MQVNCINFSQVALSKSALGIFCRSSGSRVNYSLWIPFCGDLPAHAPSIEFSGNEFTCCKSWLEMARSVSASDFSEISRCLLEIPLDVQSVTLPNDVVAECCGRNVVWRLTFTDGRKQFMKFCDDITTFQRETQGLRLAGKLAAQDDRFMSASIVYSDKNEKVFVTEALPGSTLLDLCKSAFRLDRNPFGKETLKTNTRLAIQRLCEWLSQLHRIQLSDTLCLYDHSAPAVSKRVQRILKKMSMEIQLLTLSRFRVSSIALTPTRAIPSFLEM